MPLMVDSQGNSFVAKRTVEVSSQAELDALDLTFPAPLVKISKAFGEHEESDLIYYNPDTESWITLDVISEIEQED